MVLGHQLEQGHNDMTRDEIKWLNAMYADIDEQLTLHVMRGLRQGNLKRRPEELEELAKWLLERVEDLKHGPVGL